MNDKKAKIEARETKSQVLTDQVEELTDKWKRAVADYHNLEMRMVKERQGWIKFGSQPLLLSLLEVVDDLERAAEHIVDNGLEMILEKLKQILKDNQVEEIKMDGFDPKLMECVSTIKGEKDKIITVEQKGYLYNQKLLRPAKVKVGKGK